MRGRPVPLVPRLTEAERAAHRAFVATLGEKAIWADYRPAAPLPAAVANQA
jgi:DNA polymerase-3 subunit epsilon